MEKKNVTFGDVVSMQEAQAQIASDAADAKAQDAATNSDKKKSKGN
jgi:hypothetical protein